MEGEKKNNSALATLTATYTDSEGEAEDRSSDEEPSPRKQSGESTQASPRASSNDSPHTKARRLVSYNDEEVEEAPMEVSDDEPKNPEEETVASQSTQPPPIDRSKTYGFSLPPEPKGKCSSELQAKIANVFDKMKTSNIDVNRVIQEKKEFRNPSIYEKLIQFCDINELGTNYPPEIYDPSTFGKESYYEELGKLQKIEMDKLEKTKQQRDVVTVLTGSKKIEDDKKRKSKWDQPAPQVQTTKAPLTTSATGTKTTVISAFGSIVKKPKP